MKQATPSGGLCLTIPLAHDETQRRTSLTLLGALHGGLGAQQFQLF